MNYSEFPCLFWLLLCIVCNTKADYHCGIRKHSYRELINHGWKVEDGQWPWHAGLFHKIENGTEYICGGTLIDQKYVLTAAHCVADRHTFDPEPVELFLLYFGLTKRLNESKHMQKRDIGTIHVHPHYSTHHNDIALLELRLPVEFTPFVIPICLETLAHRDLRDIEGQRGYVTGWGMTENGTLSDELRSASMPVVSYMKCLENDRVLFGKLLTENVFCAGDRNGTSPAQGDSGGGMYFSEGDRWVLRGIVSFAKYERKQFAVDTSKFVVFTYVQRYLTWIREVMDDRTLNPTKKNRPKRISEMECDRFKNLVTKDDEGYCMNNKNSYIVSVQSIYGVHMFNGILLNENHVLTTCKSLKSEFNERNGFILVVRIGDYGIVNISSSICHPAYKANSEGSLNDNNIAVINLNSTVKLSPSIIPACLASNKTENLYDKLRVKGFRWAVFFSRSKGSLEFFETKVTATEQCEITHSKDQAGGLLCMINDESDGRPYYAHGAALQTFNRRTCLPTVMGLWSQHSTFLETDIYVRVMSYLSWIEETVWGQLVVPNSSTSAMEESNATKRISAKECDRFKSFARKSSDGSCFNAWNSHRVSFFFFPTSGCHGYLINENHVLTMRDCAHFSLDPMRLGNYKLYTSEIIDYPANYSYKISIVRLTAAVHLSYQTIPICLESNWTENLNDALMITYFYTDIQDGNSEIRMDVNQVLTLEECNRDARIKSRYSSIDPDQFCVIGYLTRNSTSNFEAEIVNNQTCLFTMVGVYFDKNKTYEIHAGSTTVPFTRMAHYLDWIEEIAWGDKFNSQTTATASEEPTMQLSAPNDPIGTERNVNSGCGKYKFILLVSSLFLSITAQTAMFNRFMLILYF